MPTKCRKHHKENESDFDVTQPCCESSKADLPEKSALSCWLKVYFPPDMRSCRPSLVIQPAKSMLFKSQSLPVKRCEMPRTVTSTIATYDLSPYSTREKVSILTNHFRRSRVLYDTEYTKWSGHMVNFK